jgi:predicted Zn-dependent peptidase
MKFIINKNPSKLTTIAVAFQAGSALESQYGYVSGLAHALEHFMFKGTEKRSSFELSRQVAYLGGDQNAFTGHDIVCYHLTLPVDHFDTGVEILSDMILNPAFPEEEFEKEKQVILEELASYNDSVGHVLNQAMNQAFYSNYQALDVIGTEESIKSITLDDVKRFYAQFYRPENMIVSVTSSHNVKWTEAVLEKYFGKADGVANFLLTEEPTSIKDTKVIDVIRDELEQAHVSLAFESVKFSSKDSMAASVLGVILGDGMDSRLFQEVRQKANLVYGISAGHQAGRTNGEFEVSFQTRLSNLEQAKAIIRVELEKISNDLPTDEEVERSKNKLRTGIYRSRQSGESMTIKAITRYFMDRKTVPSIGATNRKLTKVTAADITRVAKKIFGGKSVMVVGRKAED